MTADAGLDADLLVRADDPVERIDAFPLSVTFVEIQDDGGLLEEVAGTGEDPVFVLPRLDGILVEDSPDCAPANRLVGFVSGAAARSAEDWRLRGFPVRAATSQAIEVITALSRGGKDRLATPAEVVLESELTSGPAANGMGMEIKAGYGCRVGKGGVFVKEQDQVRALSEMRRRGASEKEPPGLGEELSREARVIKRRRARHETTPNTCGQRVFSDESPSIAAASTSR